MNKEQRHVKLGFEFPDGTQAVIKLSCRDDQSVSEVSKLIDTLVALYLSMNGYVKKG